MGNKLAINCLIKDQIGNSFTQLDQGIYLDVGNIWINKEERVG